MTSIIQIPNAVRQFFIKTYRLKTIFTGLAFLFFLSNCSKNPDQSERVGGLEDKRINEFQIIGSHNSYRIKTYEPLFNFVMSLQDLLPPQYHPEAWDYDHVSLSEQLSDYQIRSFELDIFNDPEGGQFYNRMGLQFVDEPVESGIPELQEPGFKILHVPDFDYETHHFTFTDALETIKDWSGQNPDHFPLIIMVEAKSSGIADVAPLTGMTEVVPYDAESPEKLDQEVKSVFGESLENIITPDMMRGDYATLNEAVLTEGWPRLHEARGKIFFVIQGGQLKNHYLSGRPNLEGRVMFTFAQPGEDHAAFVIRNNSVSSFNEIRELVKEGYIVRTRADANTTEARTGDKTRKNAALESGAQIISTDYYKPDPRAATSEEWTDYHVQFPHQSVAKWNPLFSGGDESQSQYLTK